MCRPASPACESVNNQTSGREPQTCDREQAIFDDDRAPVTIVGYVGGPRGAKLRLGGRWRVDGEESAVGP